MDLQGIGSLASALVALVGVPAAVLVGRWNARAVREQAMSALAAAQDTAQSAHEQWRRTARRDAYTTFLLAVDKFRGVARRKYDQEINPDDRFPNDALEGVTEAVDVAYAVIQLEGPAELVPLATELRYACWPLANLARWRAPAEQARAILEMALRSEASGSPDAHSPRARAEAVSATIEFLEGTIFPAGLGNESDVRAAHEHADLVARTSGLFTQTQRTALLRDAMNEGRRNSGRSLPEEEMEAEERYGQRYEQFVQAARAVLDGLPVPPAPAAPGNDDAPVGPPAGA